MLGSWFFPWLTAGLAYFGNKTTNPDKPPVNRVDLFKEYDFIVIGGGSAGAVVANRLSEDPRWRVLLLEAGGQETELSDVPILAGYLQLGTMDWQYKTEPQPGRACLSHLRGRCNWPRGKVIGGSSVLNYMLYVRGNRRDYDEWAKQGNPGWSYDDVLPYFKKSEDNMNPSLAGTKYHGKGGYLTVEEAPYRTPLAEIFVQAGTELGFQNRDGNGEFQTGFMIAQGTTKNGRRCSTSKAFLRPIRNRKNLHIALGSHVTKIVINETTGIVRGVQFYRANRTWTISARREVILSAGAINSPQILMLSGIGRKDHLESFGIKVLKDLSVGDNLQDHYGSAATTFTLNQTISLVQQRFENVPDILRYIMFGKGPLTIMGGVEALAWIPTKFVNGSEDWPDIEFHFVSGSVGSDGGRQVRKIAGLDDQIWSAFKPLSFEDTWTVIPMLLRPKSRGTIRLRSVNPFDKPVIEAGYFSHPNDMEVLVEGIKVIIALSQTKAFQSVGSKYWNKIPIPGCETIPSASDEYFACVSRHFTSTIYHYSGTAKMGPPEDPDSVVNHELKVYGIRGLRVVDASIMPTVPSGNTNAPTIMVGERASDLIKAYWYKSLPRRKRRDLSDWPTKN